MERRDAAAHPRCLHGAAPDAPDLRGLWKAFAVEISGTPSHEPPDHVERIEQCGDRVVITAGGVIHDMRADGTLENGVNDVSGVNWSPIHVAAVFEGDALVLHPTRRRQQPNHCDAPPRRRRTGMEIRAEPRDPHAPKRLR